MRSRRGRQSGQATTEFVVLCLALVPIALIVPLLGKYIDMMHATEMASRYVAFEGAAHHSSTGWKSDAVLAEEVRGRFLGASRIRIVSADVPEDVDSRRNPAWRDHAGRPLIDRFDTQVSVSSVREGFNFHGPTRPVWREGLALPEANLSTATVTVRPRNVPGLPPFDAIDLEITRRAALLADPWAAGSVAHVRSRIEDGDVFIYPMGRLEPLVEALAELPALLGDEPLQPRLRDWERVPCDRLQGGC